MRVFQNKWFHRWARNEGIADADLCTAAAEVAGGRVEADLGSYLFKKRIARHGGGKSGGYRTILGYRRANSERMIFLYGFAKSERANIAGAEHEALSTAAGAFITATDDQVVGLVAKGSVFELECEQP